MIRNALRGFLGEYQATEQPIQQRGTILPLGIYEDGSAHLAWPGLIMDGIEGWGNLQDSAAAARENPSLMFDDEFNKQAAGDSFLAAGLAATGGVAAGAASVPENSLGMFAGRMAKTADQNALAKAEQMASQGVPREQIWSDTGWFQGVDGKWRFEIDDSGARLTPWTKEAHGAANIAWGAPAREAAGITKTPTAMNFEQWMSHPEVDRAYWPIREQSPSVFYDNSPTSNYMRDSDTITMRNTSVLGDDGGLSTGLHETQHAIQNREGFARGGSRESMAAPMNSRAAWEARLPAAIRSELDARGIDKLYEWDDAWPSIKESLRQRIEDDMGQPFKFRTLPGMDGLDEAGLALEQARIYPAAKLNEIAMNRLKDTGTDAYRRLAGETEARAVQKRQNLTPDERRARPPWLDYDVPESDQIVRFGSDGPQMSAAGAVPDNALASNAIRQGGDRASAAVNALEDVSPIRAYRGSRVAEPPGAHRDAYWASSNPDVAMSYTGAGFAKMAGPTMPWAHELSPNITPVDMRFKSPLVIDNAAPTYWDSVEYNGFSSTDDIADWARRQGYDGMEVRNVIDGGSAATTYAALRPGTVFSATTGEQLFSNPRSAPLAPAAINALDDQAPKGIRAYHGSPHDFDQFAGDDIYLSADRSYAEPYQRYVPNSQSQAPSWQDAMMTDNSGRKPGGRMYEAELSVSPDNMIIPGAAQQSPFVADAMTRLGATPDAAGYRDMMSRDGGRLALNDAGVRGAILDDPRTGPIYRLFGNDAVQHLWRDGEQLFSSPPTSAPLSLLGQGEDESFDDPFLASLLQRYGN